MLERFTIEPAPRGQRPPEEAQDDPMQVPGPARIPLDFLKENSINPDKDLRNSWDLLQLRLSVPKRKLLW